ncbi:MAG: diguanylate cyclase, partial [Gammaproteobacteria bacterium]|nr:diguanylate cyclase [Gammaproteobacteria bacterium]
MTFTLRTILGVVVLNLLVLMAVVKIGIGALDRANTNELIKHAQSTAEYLATATKPFLVSRDFDSLSAAVEEFTSNPSVAYARLLDRDGKIVVDSRAIKDKSLTVFDLEQLPRDENIFHVNANVADGASYFGKVELGINRNSIDSVSREVLIEYAMVGALGIAASIFVSFLFTRQMTHRLRQLVKGTKELIVHGKEIVLPDKGRDEVAETAKSFNQLAQRIQTQKSEFETITAASMDCIILADEGGKIIHFNSHAKKTFGYKPEDVLGKSMVEMLIPPNMRSAQEARIKNYLATRNSSLLGERVRILAQRSNGSQFPAELLIRAAEHGEGITFVIYLRDRTEIHDAEAKLDDLAYKDDITGLPNRVLLRDRLKQAMIEADSRDRLVAVVLLDLDRFKNINDSLGHEKGDLLIQEVANRLLSTVRRGDTIARLGGDEFVLVMADIAEAEDVHKVAQKIIDRVAEPIYIGDMELFVSVSIGIAFYPVDDIEVDDLLKNADTAMYRSKSMGGGCYQYYSSEMSSQVQDKLTMENALRHALDRNELLLYYQPQVDLKTGNIYGMEA